MKMLKHCLALTVVASLVGCQATGEQYESDVFDASQVNTQQEAKTVKILTVSPTKIKVSNEKNKNAAMMVGGVLGALGGAALGAGKNTDTAIVGGVAGGGAGALAGSMKLGGIHIGQAVDIRVMGDNARLRGHVQSFAAGIEDRDRTSGANLLPNVNPAFSWVRLAQRIPVRIAFDEVPADFRMIAGRTATVSIIDGNGQ